MNRSKEMNQRFSLNDAPGFMRCIKGILFIAIGLMLTSCRSASTSSGCYALLNYTISDGKIPAQIMEIYRQKTEDSPVLRSQIGIAGNLVMFYAFRFRRDSKLKEITISPDGKSVMVYDAPEN